MYMYIYIYVVFVTVYGGAPSASYCSRAGSRRWLTEKLSLGVECNEAVKPSLAIKVLRAVTVLRLRAVTRWSIYM